MPMWYEKLGINSIGAQCGGPVDGRLSDIKVEHWVAEQERSSEREPADSLRDKANVIGGWLPSLTIRLCGERESV